MSYGKDDPFPFPISSIKSYDDDELLASLSFYENEQIGIVNIVAEYISKLSRQHKGLVSDISQSFQGAIQSISDPIGFYVLTKNEIRYSPENLVLLGKELKVFFKVPNHQILSSITPTLNRNEAVAVLINFFLLMIEAILRFKEGVIHCIKGSIEILRTQLEFLITFLGDKAMHMQPTKNIVIDIEAVGDEVGSFFYSFFLSIVVYTVLLKLGETFRVTIKTNIEAVVYEVKHYLNLVSPLFLKNMPLRRDKCHEFVLQSFSDLFIFTKYNQNKKTGILSLALSDLLTMFDLLKAKITIHCITISKMPMDMAPNTAIVSLFIVDSVLDDLIDLINNKPDRIVGVKNQIVMLHEELMLLGSSIKEIAEQSEAECEELVIRAGDIAYEVEYVINSFPHVWYLTFRLPQLIKKIRLFTMAVKKIKNNVGDAGPGMLEVGKYEDEQVLSQSEKSPVLEDTIVGFEKVATEIVKQLVRGTGHLQIISIFGMPGLGKTTLANKLYNDPFVVYHFHKRSWCAVSQRYNKKNVLIEILSSMSLSKRETFVNMEEESLAENVYKNLRGRRYLIVIDDIWDVNVWNDLRRYFPNDAIGSRILFTTRNKEVGLKASPCSVINALPFLSEAECWELLQWKVFQGKNCPQELIHIGMQIATNCSGLPLAVVVIAGVLANLEKKEHLWQKVARNLISYISKNPGNCIQILELSYKHLPMHLRPCFLYFGAFEEDKEISVRKLICLWVAEGYIRKEEEKCLEDVALKYLMELIDRSLVLVSKRRSDGEVKTCKIHDILHEMCLKIAEEKII